MLRGGFADLMKQFENIIAKNVMMLFRCCPSESVTTRKELLVATRHILITDFRNGFSQYLDDLIDESLLLGPGKQSQELLRPLVCSTISDLVNHFRDCLNYNQITKIIHIFSKIINDNDLPLSAQSTSVKVLLGILEKLQIEKVNCYLLYFLLLYI